MKAVEAVARAIALDDGSTHEELDKMAGDERIDPMPEYRRNARAALSALRDCAPTRAMAESVATDDEGSFPSLGDLIDCSGENKTHTILRQAWVSAIDAMLAENPE